jgi:hypothetical protein
MAHEGVAMTGFHDFLFLCVICESEVRDYPHRNGRDRHLSPICRYCEGFWTQRVGKPSGGSFMDRRKSMQIFALAEALHSKAAAIQWGAQHGST